MFSPPSPPSPPSPITPPTPDWIIEERYKARIAREKEIERMRLYINLVDLSLAKLPAEEQLVTCFSDLINSDMSLEKRYYIAEAINDIFDTNDLDNKRIQLQIVERFKIDIFDSSSALYRALNYQRNLIPLTLFGEKHIVSWDYAKSLQLVQSIVEKEDNRATLLNK